MACVLYKDGEIARVAPEHLKSHLDAGWSVEDPARKPAKPKAPRKPKKKPEEPIVEV